MKHTCFFFAMICVIITCCKQPAEKEPVAKEPIAKDTAAKIETPVTKEPLKMADAATILARTEVPVLCYHQIREWTSKDSKVAKDYIVRPETFKATLKLLADSGYHTILPEEMYNYLAYGSPLPGKPVMLTFDDTDNDQYTVAWPEMKKYGFKGVFFIMTVSLNRPRYMSREAVKELADAGNAVESHTWDHHKFTKYLTDADWQTQVEKPKQQIVDITGKPADYFAYPYGLWNEAGIPELKKRGIKAAYQLSTKRDANEPLYTIRRMIASGYWTPEGTYKSMLQTFHLTTL